MLLLSPWGILPLDEDKKSNCSYLKALTTTGISESLFVFGLDVLENHLFSGICKHTVKFNDPGSVENLPLCCSSQIIRFMLKDL